MRTPKPVPTASPDEILKYDCTVCRAKPGQPCSPLLDQDEFPAGSFHSARAVAFQNDEARQREIAARSHTK